MGLILDTSVLIARERRGESVAAVLRDARDRLGEFDLGLSTVSVVELTHGIYRARTAQEMERRRSFCESVFDDLILYPVTSEIAQLAGRIEGEQAARGITIGFEDLVIGATALSLGFDVATLNRRHFDLIPGLTVASA